MPADTPVVRLMAVISESVLYGIAATLYVACMCVLWTRRKNASSLPLMAVTSLLFVVSSIHTAFNIRGVYQAFITNTIVDTPANAAEKFFAGNHLQSKIKETSFAVTGFIADAVLIWRLWVVWGHNWIIIIFPILMYIGSFIAGVVVIDTYDNFAPTKVFISKLINWANALWSLQFATNVIVTSLIAGRIYYVSRAAGKLNKPAYSAIIAIVESGAMYSLSLLFQLVFFQIQTSEAGSLVGDLTAQFAIIAPTLIIVRAGIKLSPTGKSFPFGSKSAGSTAFKFTNNGKMEKSSSGATATIEVETSTHVDGHKGFYRHGSSESV